MILGFSLALVAPSAFISYIIVFLSGMMGGRLLYNQNHKLKIPYYLILAGFLIGFIFGTFYGSRAVIIILFVLGGLLSYHLYDKKYLHDLWV